MLQTTLISKVFEWFEKLVDGPKDVTVTVRKGDSLWTIAEELTGDGANWQRIADANPDKHFTKDYVIQPGDVLHIPKG